MVTPPGHSSYENYSRLIPALGKGLLPWPWSRLGNCLPRRPGQDRHSAKRCFRPGGKLGKPQGGKPPVNTYRWFRSNSGGGALRFQGELQYLSVPIDVPETEYTVEFWFRTEDPNAGLFSVVDQNLGIGGHDRHIHLIDGNARIRTWSGPGEEVSSGLNLADGKWHHIAHVISLISQANTYLRRRCS